MSIALNRLGRGWGFPVAIDREGRLPLADGPDKVRESIGIILDTEPGERVMLPGFGVGLRRYLAEPNTVAVRALIKRDVELGLGTWEPRINLDSVDVSPGDDPAEVLIAIAYTHLRDGRPDNLVYPFSLS